MNLFELAISSYLFRRVIDFDESFLAFMDKVDGALDLNRLEHREGLLRWLNKWGCRQFVREYHQHASKEIAAWYAEDAGLLPAKDISLQDLSEKQMGPLADTYYRLSKRTASFRKGNRPVAIGPVGSAKILFAVRPRALPPWDNDIRHELGSDGTRDSYTEYLMHVKDLLNQLAAECQQKGFRVADFPARVGRPQITLPKLIDEYYWLTITKKVRLPDHDTVRQWLALA